MTSAKKIRHAFNQASTDKGFSHEYEKHYAKDFKEYTPDSLLEIGVKRGESLAAWSILFPSSKIAGLDIEESAFKPFNITFSNAKIIIGDSTKKETAATLDNYDVIIDDGSHYYKDILKTFINFQNKFNKYYIIEDLMYKQEFVVKLIQRMGFKVTVCDSKIQNVYVNKHWLRFNIRKNKELIPIDVKFLIVEKS